MKTKKITAACIIGTTILGSAVCASAIDVYVDNVKTTLTDSTGSKVEPFIRNGSTYVPLRGVSEALNCEVEWDGSNRTVKVYQDKSPSGKVFRNNSDDIKVYVDDEEVELEDANGSRVLPFIIDGTTYIPLRGISQVLGCWVRWDGSIQRVSIYQNVLPSDGVTLTENKPYEMYCVEAYYENDGTSLDIGGEQYYNALKVENNWFMHFDGYVLFNLDAKYDSLTFTMGHVGWEDDDKEIVFIVDGKEVKSLSLQANKYPYEVNVPLNRGLQLKIVKPQDTYGAIGLGNIVFH